MGRENLLFIYALSNAQIRATSISIIATIYHFFTDKNINIYGELGIWFIALVLALRRQKNMDGCYFYAS